MSENESYNMQNKNKNRYVLFMCYKTFVYHYFVLNYKVKISRNLKTNKFERKKSMFK